MSTRAGFPAMADVRGRLEPVPRRLRTEMESRCTGMVAFFNDKVDLVIDGEPLGPSEDLSQVS